MSEDASLDDYAGLARDGDGGAADETPDREATGGGRARDGDPAGEDPTEAKPAREGSTKEDGAAEEGVAAPAVSVYRFSPTGAACEACGATVRARWHDGAPGESGEVDESGEGSEGGALVCAECKAW
ncbi:hypothetical protein BRC90_02140 [Halobacteriales archaeon QS_4_69_34]|nr:MAG: hypothetical protein BRC90_02140 [Halobacteriales archaeon QS_4_69_34]